MPHATRQPAAPARSRPATNPILQWALSQRRSPAELIEFLRASRDSLDASLGASRAAKHRLARTLFFEYARGHGLSCGELAMLLGDAAALSREALRAIERRAEAQSRRGRWTHARRARSP